MPKAPEKPAYFNSLPIPVVALTSLLLKTPLSSVATVFLK